MKPKHIKIRIKQCLALAEASNCPRRKFGALLLDPERNVVLMDGYNGGPRGGGELCAGHYCERDGLTKRDVKVSEDYRQDYLTVGVSHMVPVIQVEVKGKVMKSDRIGPHGFDKDYAQEKAEEWAKDIIKATPKIKSGTHMEKGCHHAEFNVIANAAAGGVKTAGAWLIITGEPCMMCAKLLHHAGIARVVVVAGGYAGSNGIDYFNEHGVEVEYVEGPQDPRSEK